MGIPIETASMSTNASHVQAGSSGDRPDSRPATVDELPLAAVELATKLFNLARNGLTGDLQSYIEAGIPPNLTNGKGDTLLMLAAYHGHVDTVSMLLRKGCDPDVVNDRGQTPLAGAVFKGWNIVVRTLLTDGNADPMKGHPSAVQAAQMFKKEEYLSWFASTPSHAPAGLDISPGTT